LRPLKLQDVAMDIGLAESTVSRATADKYVDTPHGVFSLKYFFISGVSDREGNEVSSENVKERIKKIIGEEDSARPLSDQRIVEELEGLDIKIARRTVTKYRESMNILSSTQRRGIR
jgi:RNA polymerase sigma-54 factor